ncbi:MAG: sigma-70 family RNA polymerase sigma factor [Myxococcota bacterium]
MATQPSDVRPSQASDTALLEAWRAGDAAAGNVLFNRHFQSVFRFFRTKVDGGVDDLVQQTFLACVEGRDRLRDKTGFRAYLFAVARNRLYMYFQRVGREDVDPAVSSLHDMGRSPSRVLVERAEERLVLEGLRRLPLDFQIALELYHWEGLTGPQLAAVLDVPEPTVRSRLRRGTQRLRDAIAELADSATVLDSTLTDLTKWAQQVRQHVDAR